MCDQTERMIDCTQKIQLKETAAPASRPKHDFENGKQSGVNNNQMEMESLDESMNSNQDSSHNDENKCNESDAKAIFV